jgi:hypothetical protein
MVLNSEPFEWLVRIAAHNAHVKDEKELARKAEADGKRKSK